MIHLEECLMEAIADYKNESINKITPSQGSQKKKNKNVVNQILYFSWFSLLQHQYPLYG